MSTTRVRVDGPEGLVPEAELETPIDPKWAFGHFHVLVGDQTIGDWHDVVTVAAVAAWWRGFAVDGRLRWDERLADLSPEDLYVTLDSHVYGGATNPIADAHGKFDISHLGMSSWDRFRVFVVEPPDGRQVVVWTHSAAPTRVAAANLPAHALQSAGESFVAALADSGLTIP